MANDPNQERGVVTRYLDWRRERRRRTASARHTKQRASAVVLAAFMLFCGFCIVLPNVATYLQGGGAWTVVAGLAMIAFGAINLFTAVDEFLSPGSQTGQGDNAADRPLEDKIDQAQDPDQPHERD